MKNKALTYILLIAVGFIWYKVFFRIKDNLTGEDAQVVAPNQQMDQIRIATRDTVELQLNYRDPFGGIKRSIQSGATGEIPVPSPIANTPRRPPAPQFIWPNIEYYGLIRNRSSKDPLALVKADGLILNLRNGDEIFNEIYVKSIAPDSVIIGYKKKRQTFYRK